MGAAAANGSALVTYDADELTMRVEVSFADLVGNVTAANIRAATATPLGGTAGIAMQDPTFPGFPEGVISGAYDDVFELVDEDSYNPAFIASNGGTISGALNALIAALNGGKAYLNIHTTAFPDGELRGFLVRLEGDYNHDGEVNAADYTVWRNLLGETGEGLIADDNHNNVVDINDYLLWRENFGLTHADLFSGGSSSLSQVPEPASLVLAGLVISALLVARRPHH
jgi:hypothetical protein